MTDEPARPYVEWGRWVAACPQRWCNGGDYYGPGETTGRIGGLGDTRFRCPRCTTEREVVWPANADDILAVLRLRPMPENRNWNLGESIEDLLLENAVHGILPPTLQTGTGLRLTDGRFDDRTALAAATLHAIGS